jgi:hypothetical protein
MCGCVTSDPTHAAEAVEEHEAIYRAIRDGKPDAAADGTLIHVTQERPGGVRSAPMADEVVRLGRYPGGHDQFHLSPTIRTS